MFIFLFTLFVLSCTFKMDKWYFIADGDPQVGKHGDSLVTVIRDSKKNASERISNIHKIQPIDFVICAGDLTSNGRDGNGMTWLFPKRKEDQLAVYIREYEEPLERAGFPVFACPGNHDFYTGRPYFHRGVINHLTRRYGATNVFRQKKKSGLYTFCHNGVMFISMGMYPYHLNWLKRNLPDTDVPIVFFWHYNTVTNESHSDWWSMNEKDAFRDVIREHNVQLIINGHWHASGLGHWYDIPVVRGSGSEFGVIEFTNNKLSNISFNSGKL